MDASNIYQSIKALYGLGDCSICDLHKPCVGNRKCISVKRTKVLDFDKVKDSYCKRKKITSLKSVDAITFYKSKFVYVELKGWEDFIANNKLITTSKINKQIGRFKFSEKYNDSKTIIESTLNNPLKDNGYEEWYFVVTDIETEINPLSVIQQNLNNLANEDFANVLSCINSGMISKITTTISTVKTVYCQCKNFDLKIQKI